MRLRSAAVANLAVHLVGLALALGMRPGTPLVALDERMAFLAGAPLQWTVGWGVWMLCALAMGGFFVLFADQLAPAVARAVLGCVAIAIAVDLICDSAQMVALPLAARESAALFVVMERWVGFAGATVANGLYTLGAVIAAFSLRGRRERLLGAALAVAGAAMCVGGIYESPRLIEIATGPTILLFCAFALSAAWSLERR